MSMFARLFYAFESLAIAVVDENRDVHCRQKTQHERAPAPRHVRVNMQHEMSLLEQHSVNRQLTAPGSKRIKMSVIKMTFSPHFGNGLVHILVSKCYFVSLLGTFHRILGGLNLRLNHLMEFFCQI